MKRMIVLVVMAVLLAGCAFAEEQPVRYTIGDISVDVPAEFTMAENNSEVLTFKRAFGSRTLLFAIRDGENVTPDTAATLMKASLELDAVDFAYDVSASINGIPYVDCTFSNSVPLLFGKAALLLDGSTDSVYVICYTSIIKPDDEDDELWNFIIHSIDAPTIQGTALSTPAPSPTIVVHGVRHVSPVTIRPAPTATSQPTLPPPLDFKAVDRNPNTYVGDAFAISGRVLQVMEGQMDDNGTTLSQFRLATDGEYGDVIYCMYNRGRFDNRVIEGDYLEMIGECFGLYSYTAVNHIQVSLPMFYVYDIRIGE